MLATLAASLTLSAAALQLAPVARAPAAVPRRAIATPMMKLAVPQNVGEAKAAFQASYGKPVGTTAQGFVGEMLSSTCFVLQTPSYEYSRIWSVGFEKLCSIFLQGLPTDADREAVRASMAIGLGFEPEMVTEDAEALTALASGGMTEDALFESADFKKVKARENFKYSYTFGAGLICMMEAVGVEPTDEAIDSWCERLGIKSGAFKRDYAYFKDSVQK